RVFANTVSSTSLKRFRRFRALPVRINQLPAGLEDLDVVLPARPSLVLIPKVESAAEVREVDRRLTALDCPVEGDGAVWLMPIIESARGLEAAAEIAAACGRVAALTIGLEDYTADLGVVKTPGGEESAWARSRLVQAARAAGCQAIDSVYGDIADLEGLERWGRRSRAMGFEGMGCIHPSQVPVVHRAFAPGPDEIERALRVVEAFEQARSSGRAVVALGSKMIDPPVVERALALVERARRMGLLGGEEGRRR
ncbi:MAG: CoA ester lyase, partial [Acidobacteriota bacterium]|nr:CoA ester lyase [Acidobacteriota bacterium]